MNLLYYLALVQIASIFAYGSEFHLAVERQPRNIFSDYNQMKTKTPAQFRVGNLIKYDNSASHNFIPERYFTNVEYPINMLEASNPFCVGTEDNNPLRTPFTGHVTTNYNFALKPTPGKGNANIVIGYKPTNNVASIQQTRNSDSAKANHYATVHKSNLNKVVSDIMPYSTQKQVTFQQPITTNQENDMYEKMTLSDSKKSYEDYYYDEDYTSTTDNGTVFGDLLVDFYSDEVSSDDYIESDSPEYSSVSEEVDTDVCNTANSTVQTDELALINSTAIESDKCPAKLSPLPAQKNYSKLNFMRKALNRVGTSGPVHNIMGQHFLNNMYNTPHRIIPS